MQNSKLIRNLTAKNVKTLKQNLKIWPKTNPKPIVQRDRLHEAQPDQKEHSEQMELAIEGSDLEAEISDFEAELWVIF